MLTTLVTNQWFIKLNYILIAFEIKITYFSLHNEQRRPQRVYLVFTAVWKYHNFYVAYHKNPGDIYYLVYDMSKLMFNDFLKYILNGYYRTLDILKIQRSPSVKINRAIYTRLL